MTVQTSETYRVHFYFSTGKRKRLRKDTLERSNESSFYVAWKQPFITSQSIGYARVGIAHAFYKHTSFGFLSVVVYQPASPAYLARDAVL